MSADTDDIRIGKGVVSFMEEGESDMRDLGWVPTFQVTPEITEKDYNSAREGITTVAITYVTKIKNSIKFRMDSIVPENLAYFALAEVETDTEGETTLLSLTKTQITGILQCVGSNDIGAKVNWIGKVSLRPSGTLDLITDGDDFSGIEIEATVIRTDEYGYGKYSYPVAEE